MFPTGIGPALHPEVLCAYGTPRRLVDYVKLAMPYDSLGSLDEAEYWDVVAYLLDEAGLRSTELLLEEGTAGAGLRQPER